ncbi:MAG: DUF5675 family protein [Azoarcus sp.]|jgi:hypothetical protein|nr:DUF5675 family protein [Azoarcus sp.]
MTQVAYHNLYLTRTYWNWGERPNGFIMGVVRLDDPNSQISFHTLELPGSATNAANQMRPILPGTYQLTKHASQKAALNGKPKLHSSSLSIQRAILMHAGASSKSSEGCIIFGMPAGWGKLKDSGHVWDTILKPWLDACNWHAQIHIEHS